MYIKSVQKEEALSKFEYKLNFEYDLKDVPDILFRITEIIKTELKDKITNVTPTFTVLERSNK